MTPFAHAQPDSTCGTPVVAFVPGGALDTIGRFGRLRFINVATLSRDSGSRTHHHGIYASCSVFSERLL
jgi:hypothetical protein